MLIIISITIHTYTKLIKKYRYYIFIFEIQIGLVWFGFMAYQPLYVI